MNAAQIQDGFHLAATRRDPVGGASLCVAAGVLGWLVECWTWFNAPASPKTFVVSGLAAYICATFAGIGVMLFSIGRVWSRTTWIQLFQLLVGASWIAQMAWFYVTATSA